MCTLVSPFHLGQSLGNYSFHRKQQVRLHGLWNSFAMGWNSANTAWWPTTIVWEHTVASTSIAYRWVWTAWGCHTSVTSCSLATPHNGATANGDAVQRTCFHMHMPCMWKIHVSISGTPNFCWRYGWRVLACQRRDNIELSEKIIWFNMFCSPCALFWSFWIQNRNVSAPMSQGMR